MKYQAYILTWITHNGGASQAVTPIGVPFDTERQAHEAIRSVRSQLTDALGDSRSPSMRGFAMPVPTDAV